MLEDFEENSCRICLRRFCCTNCRIHHEENEHKVQADCDICFYGKAYISEPRIKLLEHIQNNHLPLHCVNCKKLFTTTEELIQHNKCTQKIEPSEKFKLLPRTPVTPANEVDYESSPKITPIYENIICSNQQYLGLTIKSVFTSTPMQKDDNKILKNNLQPESITTSNIEIKSFLKSSIKTPNTNNDSKKNDRKVTFSETPTIEFSEQRKISRQNSTNSNNTKYYTATEILVEEKENFDNEMLCSNSENTIWVSAVTSSDWAVSNNVNNTKLNFGGDTPVLQVLNHDSPNNCSKLWTSMTSLVKSVMEGLSMTTPNSSNKRAHPDYDNTYDELPIVKRRKFVDVKCRRPIRKLNPLSIDYRYKEQTTQTSPLENINLLVSSSTQTDFV